MPPARRLALTALGVLAAWTLAGCSPGAPSVLVATEAVERLPSPPAAEAGDPGVTTLAAPSDEAPEARPSVGDGVLIEGLGLLSSRQHDVAFGSVVNPTVTGRVSSTHSDALEAVRVMAVCTVDGEPVAAGFGRVPRLPAHGDAAYEVTLYGATPDTCEVTATR